MPKHTRDMIPGFNLVAPTIWEHIPCASEKLQVDTAPDMIIIFSWTGAQGKNTAKYTDTYQTLFPNTSIFVITTSAKDLCFRSSRKKQSRLQPAIDRVRSYGSIQNVLIHVFSEGGSNKAVEFAEAYHNTTGHLLPCSALCLDSTPGHARFVRLCNALRKSLPPYRILRYSGLIIGGTIIGGIWIIHHTFKGLDNNVISKTRRRLMDDTYWNLGAPRCYLYSKADELIKWQDVHEHASQASEAGIPVMEVCFERSNHCRHVAEDPEKYWDAVKAIWYQRDKDEKDGVTKRDNFCLVNEQRVMDDDNSQMTLFDTSTVVYECA